MGITLCDDGIFRGFFGRLGSEEMLTDLVNAVLRNAGEPTIQNLEIRNPFQYQELLGQKETVLDVKAQDEFQAWYDVEVQTATHLNFRERVLYYWSKMYSGELEKGNSYDILVPAISIVFIKFPLYADAKNVLCDSFQICSRRFPNRVYSDHLKLHFICVPEKVDFKTFDVGDPTLRQWLKALNYPQNTSEEEMTNIATENPVIGNVLDRAKDFLAQPEIREFLEAREKRLRDEEAIRRTLRLEAIKEGRDEGLAQGRNEGLAQGLAQGRLEGQINGITTILTERFSEVPQEIEERLRKKNDLQELKGLLISAATCSDLDEFRNYLS